jgi:hypothetical protein
MADPNDRSEARQQALNPHRDEDRQRAAQVAYSQLHQRGVAVTGDEDPDALADILDAVEQYENAMSMLGADRMTNAPDSAQPDDRRLVLPARLDGEDAERYARRIRSAADGIMSRAPADAPRQGAGDAAMGGLAADAQG